MKACHLLYLLAERFTFQSLVRSETLRHIFVLCNLNTSFTYIDWWKQNVRIWRSTNRTDLVSIAVGRSELDLSITFETRSVQFVDFKMRVFSFLIYQYNLFDKKTNIDIINVFVSHQIMLFFIVRIRIFCFIYTYFVLNVFVSTLPL